jgi:curved DNA-binding protein CbpA
MKNTLYDVLGITDKAPPEEVMEAYHALKEELQDAADPESQNRMKLVRQAYVILSDPMQREKYDQSIKFDALKSNTVIQYEPRDEGSGWAMKLLLAAAIVAVGYFGYQRYFQASPQMVASAPQSAGEAASNAPSEARPEPPLQEPPAQEQPATPSVQQPAAQAQPEPRDIKDVDVVPLPSPLAQRDAYLSFLRHPPPRAFAICSDGRVTSIVGSEAFVQQQLAALPAGCSLYARNNDVVWAGK